MRVSRRSFTRAALVAALAAPLFLAACMSAPPKPERLAIAAWLDADYDKRLAAWPVPAQEVFLPTRFGPTHAIVSGPAGSPVLMLFHAMGMNGLAYAPNIAALSEGHRVYAFDTIGDIGRSIARRDYPENGREYADWVADLVAATGARRASIAGTSMGGWIATCTAVYRSDLVDRLILISPAAGIPQRTTWGEMIFSLLLDSGERNVRKIGTRLLGRGATNRDWNDYFYRATQDPASRKLGMPSELSDKELRTIASPTLLLIGDEEVIYVSTQEVVERASRLVPHLTAMIIPHAGHVGHYDNPQFVNSAIAGFLQK